MRYIFRLHALQRMLERNITKEETIRCIENGTVVEAYPDDSPYPSLLKRIINDKPLHVVYAEAKDCIIVITVYRPDPTLWDETFTRRKK